MYMLLETVTNDKTDSSVDGLDYTSKREESVSIDQTYLQRECNALICGTNVCTAMMQA